MKIFLTRAARLAWEPLRHLTLARAVTPTGLLPRLRGVGGIDLLDHVVVWHATPDGPRWNAAAPVLLSSGARTRIIRPNALRGGQWPKSSAADSKIPIVTRSLLDSIGVLPLHRRMDDDSHRTTRKRGERVAREERLAKALRDNLRRRKEQARAQEQLGLPQSKEPRGGGEPTA
jgi:hypothetical protein